MAKNIKQIKPWAFSEGDLRKRIQQWSQTTEGITVFYKAAAAAPLETQAATAYKAITLAEVSAPTPETDQGMLYVKSDGKLYFKGQSEGNTEIELTANAASVHSSVTLSEISAPTPGTDQGVIYVKSDGKLYFKGQSEGSTEVDLTSGGGSSDLSSTTSKLSSSYAGDNIFLGNLIIAKKNGANSSLYVSGSVNSSKAVYGLKFSGSTASRSTFLGEVVVGAKNGANSDLHVSGSVSIGTSSPLTALEVHHKNVNPTALSNDTGGGEVVYFGGGSSLTTGKLYYLGTDGNWALTDSDATTSGAEGLLAIALGATPGTNGMMIRGFFDANTAMNGCKFVKGSALYATSGSGLISVDKPSTHGSFIRAIGHCTDTAKVIYLSPDGIYAEVKHKDSDFAGIKTSSPSATTAWTFGSGSFTIGSGSSKY